jgi:hypothetical protein
MSYLVVFETGCLERSAHCRHPSLTDHWSLQTPELPWVLKWDDRSQFEAARRTLKKLVTYQPDIRWADRVIEQYDFKWNLIDWEKSDVELDQYPNKQKEPLQGKINSLTSWCLQYSIWDWLDTRWNERRDVSNSGISQLVCGRIESLDDWFRVIPVDVRFRWIQLIWIPWWLIPIELAESVSCDQIQFLDDWSCLSTVIH